MGISALLASQILDASATGRSVITGADASAIRTTLGLGTLSTQSPTGTPSASTFLRGDFSWQTIDLSGYVPYTGATGALNLGSNSLTAGAGTFNGNVLVTAQTNNASLLRLNSSTGTGTAQLGQYAGGTTYGAIWFGNITAGNSNYAFLGNGINEVTLNAPAGGVYLAIATSIIQTVSSSGVSVATDKTFGFGSDITLARDTSDTLAQRRSTNSQRFNLYGTFTDASNYRRLFLSSTTAGAFTLGVEGAGTGASGNTLTLGNPVSVAGGTITASTPALNVSQTWNNAATTFTGILANVTDTASNSASLLMDLQVGGSSKLRVGKLGIITPYVQLTDVPTIAAQNVSTQTMVYVGYAHSFRLGATEVPRVQVDPVSGLGIGIAAGGGMNNGAWLINEGANLLAQRNSTNAQAFRVYNTFTDASNYERAKIAWSSNVLQIGTEKAGTGSARALELQTDGTTRLTISTTGAFTIANALDIAVGTTTGTKIGTATTQKLGFFNATPVVQPTAVANATDAASVITQLNALLSRMRDLGLIAT